MKKGLLKKLVILTIISALTAGIASCSKKTEEQSSLREAATTAEQSEILAKAKAQSKADETDNKDSAKKDSKNGSADLSGNKDLSNQKSSDKSDKSADTVDTSDEYKPGQNTDSDFESEFIGVKIKLPSGYSLESQENIDAMNARGASSEESQYFKYEASITNAEKTLQVIIASDGHQSEYSEKEYTEMIAQEYSQGAGAEVADEVRSVEIAGKEYAAVDISLSSENKIKYCIRKKGDEMISFIFVYKSEAENEINKLMSEFKPYGA